MRSFAKMVCRKSTNYFIQLLFTVEYLPLLSPCFLKIDCRGMSAVGTVRALGPVCFCLPHQLKWIRANFSGKRTDMWSVFLKLIPVTCSAEICSWSQRLDTLASKDSSSQHYLSGPKLRTDFSLGLLLFSTTERHSILNVFFKLKDSPDSL